jgi:hypothetical protein
VQHARLSALGILSGVGHVAGVTTCPVQRQQGATERRSGAVGDDLQRALAAGLHVSAF